MTTKMRLPRGALATLAQRDPALGRVIERVGAFRLELGTGETHLGALLRSIVFQQLSTKAATTIHGRVRALFATERHPTAAEILAMDPERLRACGLSRQKLASVYDLAAKVDAGEVALDRFDDEPDDAIVAELVRVRGIGVWSAQMFLMFHLGRPDVWPADDLGIRKGVALVRRLPKTPTAKETAALGARYAPYRTVAAWYLWRALDLPVAPAKRPPAR